ncbi:hypothetical protein R50073_08900 [Maricurvus nonylphenolicus]|uniref:hypothetical protein n=1 Tax=Maricurvus nonylphenolicus TaxID=1008307 RepID=UPI0036F32BF5
MLLPTILFLIFTFWTLRHWQSLPELLQEDEGDNRWPLSMDHATTPTRLWLVSGCYALFSYILFWGLNKLLVLLGVGTWAPWWALGVLVVAHYLPYLKTVCAFIRYFFQRHLFFPVLPSHQEYPLIHQLLEQQQGQECITKELDHVYGLLKQEFNTSIHAFNIVALKEEWQLVRAEHKNIRRKVLSGVICETTEQQLRLQLYACCRLLVRLTLARFWSGKERRKEFRRLGYCINTGDGALYGSTRRLWFGLWKNVFSRSNRRLKAR